MKLVIVQVSESDFRVYKKHWWGLGRMMDNMGYPSVATPKWWPDSHSHQGRFFSKSDAIQAAERYISARRNADKNNGKIVWIYEL